MKKDFFKNIEKATAKIEGAPFIVQKRHWGFSVVLDANTRLHLIAGEPSVHFHRYRTEDYILFSGEMVVYRGKNIAGNLEKTVANLEPTKLAPGDRVIVLPNIVHIPVNLKSEPAVFFEISHGPYAEEDVERIYDKNGRDSSLVQRWSDLEYKEGMSVKDLISQVRNKLRRK